MEGQKIYDYIILGGGLAGLYCARELLKQYPSRSVVLVEKYKMLGGRAVTFQKTLPGIGPIQWEIGAGRISTEHTMVLSLLREYGLKTAPIGSELVYKKDGDSPLEDNLFEPSLNAFLKPLRDLSKEILATHTLEQLLIKVHGPAKTKEWMNRFPYHAEMVVYRADEAMNEFTGEMKSHEGYSIVVDGLSALAEKMAEDIVQRGGVLLPENEVVAVGGDKKLAWAEMRVGSPFGPGKGKRPIRRLTGKKLICALPVNVLQELSLFQKVPLIKRVTMEPLTRMYAVFPLVKGKAWFFNLPRVVTTLPIRYILPIDKSKGTIMISYTDSKFARYFTKIQAKEGEEGVQKEVMKQVRELFPEREIPDPLYFKIHEWPAGVSYWLPGKYSPSQVSQEMLRPLPKSHPNLYVCGESFSLRQGWMEGALEHADLLLKKYLQ
jgi:monoamine oxidase